LQSAEMTAGYTRMKYFEGFNCLKNLGIRYNTCSPQKWLPATLECDVLNVLCLEFLVVRYNTCSSSESLPATLGQMFECF